MSVKKITAPSMPEAMKRVKREMGEEAVILSSRVIWTGGILGLFKKKQFEVIAVADGQQALSAEKNPVAAAPEMHESSLPADIEKDILSELAELKRAVSDAHRRAVPKLDTYPPAIQAAVKRMLNQEIKESFALDIADKLLNEWRQAKEEPSEADMLNKARDWLTCEIKKAEGNSQTTRKQFIALAGPTGVGKTTTLAKLAAYAALEENKRVAFITLDTYRIAAIDQLKTYAELLNVPAAVVYEQQDLIRAVNEFKELDHIFIDTAGRNYREIEYVHGLSELLPLEEELELYLAVPVSIKENDLEAIMANFKQLPISKLIFTKADETAIYGPMANMIFEYRLPAAYITNGQEVPDDLIEATPQIISDYIFGEQAQ